MEDSIHELVKITSAIHPLSPEEMNAFTSTFHEHTAKRKATVTINGTTERYLYFVATGVQRIYSIDEAGNEATIIFTYPYSFGGVLDSFMLQQPSRYQYETLTASSFLRSSFADLQQVRKAFPNIEMMLNKGLSFALSGVLERLAQVQTLSSGEKLKKFFERSPHLFHMIPQKYLADYLGIDPTNFSKFMNNLRL